MVLSLAGYYASTAACKHLLMIGTRAIDNVAEAADTAPNGFGASPAIQSGSTSIVIPVTGQDHASSHRPNSL